MTRGKSNVLWMILDHSLWSTQDLSVAIVETGWGIATGSKRLAYWREQYPDHEFSFVVETEL